MKLRFLVVSSLAFHYLCGGMAWEGKPFAVFIYERAFVTCLETAGWRPLREGLPGMDGRKACMGFLKTWFSFAEMRCPFRGSWRAFLFAP